MADETNPNPPTPTDPAAPVDHREGDMQWVDTKMPGKYRVKVNRAKCISAGSCIAIAPKVFKFDEKNIATVISQDELDDLKLLAAQSCPVLAIVVEDMETGKQVWPQE